MLATAQLSMTVGNEANTDSRKTNKEEGQDVGASVRPEEETVEVERFFDEFVEREKKAITEATKAVESLLPPGFKKHGEAALKEMVEGYRGLINSAIDEIMAAIERKKLDDKDDGKKI